VGRTLLIVSVLALASFLLIQAIVTTDRERVEAEIGRLADLARKGGPEAAAAIRAAFADDYRGTGAFALREIERQLERWVAPAKLRKVTLGDPQPIATDSDGILVPILRVTVESDGGVLGTFILTMTWGERDGTWKIVDITRWGN